MACASYATKPAEESPASGKQTIHDTNVHFQVGKPDEHSGGRITLNGHFEKIRIKRCRSESFPQPYNQKLYTLDHFPRLKYHHQQVIKLSKRMKTVSQEEKGNMTPSDSTRILLYVAGDITRKTEKLIAPTKDEGFSYCLSRHREWPVSALIYFQNEDEPLTRIEEIIDTFQPIKWKEVFIVTNKFLRSSEPTVVSKYPILQRTKKSVREAITSFLETPLRDCIKGILVKLEYGHHLMQKEELSNLRKDCRSVFLLLSPERNSTNKIQIPDSIKKYLFQQPDIHGFGIWEASEFRVFATNDTDIELLKSKLCELSVEFLKRFPLNVVIGEMKFKMYTKQGEKLFLETERETSYATTGALLRNDQDPDDIYGLTCHHVLQKEKQEVFAKFSPTSAPSKFGECIYSEGEPNRDVAVFRVDEDKREMCDTTFLNAMKNPCNVNVQESQISPDAIVHKKGASTAWTTGRIKSPELYAKVLGERSKLFAVSSTEIDERPFSAPGDSGSVVFQHDNSPSQKSVFALGLVTGKIDEIRDDSIPEAENATLCLRLNTALSCLSEKKQLHLQFESSGRESSSSDEY